MRTGYSFLVDEYVDASLAEPVDCDALGICCPVCQERLVLEAEVQTPCFRHAVPLFPSFEADCESRSSEFGPEYCHQHNNLARRQRLKFLRWDLFKLLLGKDPLGPCKDAERAWEETPKLLRMGVLSRVSDWHWRSVVRPSRERLQDPVEFFATAEHHLRSTKEKLPDVPESGLRRQVHFQIAFDLMKSLVAREDFGEDYDWLFVHAFRICVGKWVSIAENAQQVESQLEPADEDAQEHAAAASILGCSALNLLSDDKEEIHNAIEALFEVETKPPIMKDRIPFIIFFGSDIAGEMQCTLCRLPYLALLRQYNRPCRPAVV